MRLEQIEDIIIATLGVYLNEKPSAIRSSLLKRGSDMPIDSFDMVKIQLQLEEHFGVDFPCDERTELACRSIRGMALHIKDLMRDRKSGTGISA